LPQSAEWILDGRGLLEDGPKAFAVLARLEHRPSAVVCYNDLTAIGLLSAANQAGIRVPEYMSVVGYDNIPLSEFTIPPLTTVDQAKGALGRTAVETCVGALSGEEVPDAVLPGMLVIRQSTGPAVRANALPSRSG
jgi:DNA-binding LacI/PurR family transcriptional regulator